jgi:hypothetical protein
MPGDGDGDGVGFGGTSGDADGEGVGIGGTSGDGDGDGDGLPLGSGDGDGVGLGLTEGDGEGVGLGLGDLGVACATGSAMPSPGCLSAARCNPTTAATQKSATHIPMPSTTRDMTLFLFIAVPPHKMCATWATQAWGQIIGTKSGARLVELGGI